MLVRNVYLKILNQFSVATHLMTRRLEPAMMTIYSNFYSARGAKVTQHLLSIATKKTLGINRHIVRESLGV